MCLPRAAARVRRRPPVRRVQHPVAGVDGEAAAQARRNRNSQHTAPHMKRGLAQASGMAIVAMAMPIALASQRTPDLLDQVAAINRLPQGCSLATRPLIVGRGQLVDINANPWRGNDRQVIAFIREVMYGPPRLVDGPPLDAAALSRFFVRLSEGIHEGYIASYSREAEEATVYALTFSDSKRLANLRNDGRYRGRPDISFQKGNTVVALYGGEGPCSRAIHSHVESLTH